MPELWRHEIEKLAPEAVAHGWRACRDSGESHPPGLPLFLARVKSGQPMLLGSGRTDPVIAAMHEAAARQAIRELPSPDKALLEKLKSAPNVAAAALAELRDKLPKRPKAAEPVILHFEEVDQVEDKAIFEQELERWKNGDRPKSWQASKT